MKRLVVVAGLIPAPGGDSSRFLVQQRLSTASRANLWEFPGGKREPNETCAEALVREGREELGVRLSVGRELWTTEHAYPDVVVQLHLFAAEIVEGTPAPLGAQSLRFATIAEMKQLPFCEADLPLLDALETGAISTR